jgi:hypothetical protein
MLRTRVEAVSLGTDVERLQLRRRRHDPRIAYTGSWTQITRTGPYANSLHSTTQSGASATVHFTGPPFMNSMLIISLPLHFHL